MSPTQPCPDCGRDNDAAADSCIHCGYPLGDEHAAAAPSPAGEAVPEASGAGPPAPAPAPPAPATPATPEAAASSQPLRPLRPIRPRRPRPPGSAIAVQLWLVFATFCALVVIFVAFKANVDRANQPVEGSSADQQRQADEMRARLARDSTDVEARVRLADILYDTANWPEAIVHYRSAVHRDSTLVNAIVDLGVCYYNLGVQAQAERHFELALSKDPHQPVALFNLGIVHEARGDAKGALEYFHRALQSGPPDKMREPLLAAMQRAQEKAGVTPAPLPDGR